MPRGAFAFSLTHYHPHPPLPLTLTCSPTLTAMQVSSVDSLDNTTRNQLVPELWVENATGVYHPAHHTCAAPHTAVDRKASGLVVDVCNLRPGSEADASTGTFTLVFQAAPRAGAVLGNNRSDGMATWQVHQPSTTLLRVSLKALAPNAAPNSSPKAQPSTDPTTHFKRQT